MLNYNKAKELWLSAKDMAKGKPYGNNTRIVQHGQDYAIQLHQTMIVKLHPQGGFTLDANGYHTHTTKKRMNAFLAGSGMKIVQRKFAWYIQKGAKTMTYNDGMKFDANGNIERISYETPDWAAA